jgi:hypothetical protein
VLVIRKRVWLLSITAAATLLVPGLAAAKDSTTLRFDKAQYAPGEPAVAHALVETWSGTGQPEDAPYTVYLVRGRPLWFGHLPTRAIPVGELRIGHQVRDRTEVGETYRVTVAFDVPRVSNGRYAVWVCAPSKGGGGKGCWIGFGDLAYGRLIVDRGGGFNLTTEPDAQAAPEAPKGVAAASRGGSSALAGLALALVAVAALTALLVRAQRGRASP